LIHFFAGTVPACRLPALTAPADPIGFISMASLSGNPLLATARRLPTADEREAATSKARGEARSMRPASRAFWAATISSLVHAMLMIACQWWWLIPPRPASVPVVLEASTVEREPAVESVDFAPELAAETAQQAQLERPQASAAAAMRVDITPLGKRPWETIRLLHAVPQWTLGATDGPDLLAKVAGADSSGLALARSATSRRHAISAGGATDASESAVDRALEWIVQHQFSDGGWSFDHRQKACKGHCDHPGTLVQARVAATSLALLPLLGAGHTHKQGKYKKAVQGGLAFLGHNMRPTADGGDLQAGGMMYSHGLATIALCEAYAMTKDRQLGGPAQAALNFITAAQDPQGGGWRYSPGMAGDTSVFGWQLMALKSGRLGYLNVPQRTIEGATHFLNSVQRDAGAQYGYTVGQDRGEADHATTAIGLLSRMLLGWKRDDDALARGVALLDRWGPSNTDLYYDYYATQVLRHYEGDAWQRWNAKLRDRLVETQARRGHETGSWYMAEAANDVGGRLYCTALCTMILEVYYRHLPLYKKHTTGETF
jgi:hypothetical protein